MSTATTPLQQSGVRRRLSLDPAQYLDLSDVSLSTYRSPDSSSRGSLELYSEDDSVASSPTATEAAMMTGRSSSHHGGKHHGGHHRRSHHSRSPHIIKKQQPKQPTLIIMPTSYFLDETETKRFSIAHELDVYLKFIQQIWQAVEEDRLPWGQDFLDPRKMRLPRSTKEALGRINLNIPYYASNYMELCYMVSLPFLFWYNTPFFLVALVASVLLHAIAVRQKYARLYGTDTVIVNVRATYRTLAHILLAAIVVLFMFFEGLRTTCAVVILNLLTVVPHALMRRCTYFDDADMEKTRPKLFQYFIALLLLALAYLEGDREVCEPDGENNENTHMARRERIKLGMLKDPNEEYDQ